MPDGLPARRRHAVDLPPRRIYFASPRFVDEQPGASVVASGVEEARNPMLGFGSFESASRFCVAFDELREYFRARRRGEAHVPLAQQRRLFLTR